MAEELYSALQQFHRDIVVPEMQRFHREVVIPDMQRMLLHFHREVAVPEIVGTLREELASFKRETHANFDSVWKRFETLESEYHSLSAAVTRIEEKLES
jgi:ATP-dependent helicase/DNAse subunit B